MRPALWHMLAFCIVATGFHFADNVLRFEDYPEPDGLTPGEAVAFWFAQTAFGVAGAFVRGWAGRAMLLGYGALGLLGLGHYTLDGAEHMDALMHTTIALEGIAGVALIVWVLTWPMPSQPAQ